MRFKLVSVLVVAFVVIAAGCGSSKKKSASPTTNAAAGTTTAGTTTASTTTSTTTTTSSAPTFATSKNCAQLIGLGAKFAQALQSTSGNAGASLNNETKAFQAMAAAAPSQIRGDFQTIGGAFSAYVQALATAGYKPGTVPSAAQLAQIQAATKAFSTPKLQAAEQHLSAWSRKNCGGLNTTTTG
jgi:hypothetical protein